MYQKPKQPRQYALDGTVAPIVYIRRKWFHKSDISSEDFAFSSLDIFHQLQN